MELSGGGVCIEVVSWFDLCFKSTATTESYTSEHTLALPDAIPAGLRCGNRYRHHGPAVCPLCDAGGAARSRCAVAGSWREADRRRGAVRRYRAEGCAAPGDYRRPIGGLRAEKGRAGEEGGGAGRDRWERAN